MNQRIRELWNQSRYPSGRGHDEEKFALLIVQECLDIAYQYDEPKMSGPGMIIANRIETHFGVEE